MKLDDLAHDIGSLLQSLEGPEHRRSAAASAAAVYLAETTSDLARNTRRSGASCSSTGTPSCPSQPLPLEDSASACRYRRRLAQCQLSVHSSARRYGIVPEGGSDSLGRDAEQAGDRAERRRDFSRLVWIPRGLRGRRAATEKADRPHPDGPADRGGRPARDVLRRFADAHARVARSERCPRGPAPPAADASPVIATATAAPPRLYLISRSAGPRGCRPRRRLSLQSVARGRSPDLRGRRARDPGRARGEPAAMRRRRHRARVGQRDLAPAKAARNQKSAGFGRTKPAPPIGIALLPPRTPDKERLRTHEATILPLWDGCDPATLGPFVDVVKGAGRKV